MRSIRLACALAALSLAAATASLAAPAPLSGDVPELRRSGFVGVQVAPAPEGRGVLVQGLVEGGSAGDAGIRAGDVIVRLDGREMAGRDDFVAAARRLKAGDTAVVTVRRAGATLEVPVPVKPRPTESAEGLEVLYESIRVDTHRRRTILTVPPGAGRHPAILFVTGVGCFSQELGQPPDNVGRLLYGLTRAGFVTMRVEKSGMGDSGGPACASPEVNFRAELHAYIEGLRALRGHGRVDPANVFIVGLSIGGVHAPFLEQAHPVKGTVVINTTAKPFMEYLLETRRRQFALRGMEPKAIDAALERVAACNRRLLVERQSPELLLAERPECREDIQYPAPYTYMQQWAALDLDRAWQAAKAPLLVVIGESDFIATVAESPALVERVNRRHPGRATLAAIPGWDHYLAKAATMKESMAREDGGEFEPRVLEVVRDWLREQVRKRP